MSRREKFWATHPRCKMAFVILVLILVFPVELCWRVGLGVAAAAYRQTVRYVKHVTHLVEVIRAQ